MPEEKTPNTEAIKKTVEESGKFVDWLIEVLRSKNWTTKLLLLDVLLFTAFNPVFFPSLLKLFTSAPLPENYPRYFWPVIGAVFVAAVVAAWRARPKGKPLRDLSESRAIKGLLPYTKDDAALFARLQREQDLTECLLAINDPSFRFGVLSGESGAGKSSFLQAGVWAEFERRKLRCVYVKFSDLDPFESVKRACLKHLSLPDGVADTADFLTLLDAAARQEASPIVLLFDQFEQFFVHRKRKKDREPFVQALARWYGGIQSSPVKILLCIRGDFLDRLNELQKAMRYSLSPAQSFRLERFEPDQATEVFCFLAEKESLEYDRKFISEMTRQELADTEDGLISPVDIQVLAWMIAGQPVQDGRAFNRTTFQKLGGVDGLLERYLTRALAVRETEARRQAAIKILLALTDLERNARAGALTLEALRQKLGGDINDAEMKEAVAWLARNDVRLVSPSSESEEEKFELAHERLIPALRRLAGKELTETDRINQLLDRRANEWVGNDRSRRYLLTWRELRSVKKQTPFMQWEPNRSGKETLIAASWGQLRPRFILASLPILLAIAFASVWYSQWGQLRLIKWEVAEFSEKMTEPEALAQIARAYAMMGDFPKAFLVAEKIGFEAYKAEAIQVIAEAYASLGEKERAAQLLSQALPLAEKLGETRNAHAIQTIAETYAKLGEKEKASQLLSQALLLAEKFGDEYFRALAIVAIAEACTKLGEKEKASQLLSQALSLAEKIDEENLNAVALEAIAKAYAGLAEKEKDFQLLRQTLSLAEKFGDEYSIALPAIAGAYAKLGEKKKASQLFSQALSLAEKIYDELEKVRAIRAIAEAYTRVGEKEKASQLLSQALSLVEKIGSEADKAYALQFIAEVSALLGEEENAAQLLSQALPLAEKIGNGYSKARAIRAIAEAYGRFGKKEKSSQLLSRAFSLAEKISDENSKIVTFQDIAKAYAKLGDFRLARASALKIPSEAEKAKTLALILEIWAKSKNPRLADEVSKDKE